MCVLPVMGPNNDNVCKDIVGLSKLLSFWQKFGEGLFCFSWFSFNNAILIYIRHALMSWACRKFVGVITSMPNVLHQSMNSMLQHSTTAEIWLGKPSVRQ